MSAGVQGELRLFRTEPLGTGVRGVLYLPNGTAMHTLEDLPIPPGRYFLTPDDTGDHRNWVIERAYGSRVACDAVVDHMGGVIAPARTNVEVHAGNTLADSTGCLMVGWQCSRTGVLQSQPALAAMRGALGRDAERPALWVMEVLGTPLGPLT